MIDSATCAEAIALRQLHVATWARTYAGLLPAEFYDRRLAMHARRDWQRLIAEQRADGGGILVARCGAGLAGLCQYGPPEDDDHPPGAGEVQRLYVHPNFQRQGIGSALLRDAAERLIAAGASSLVLWVLESDPRARAFYEGIGFSPDCGRRFDGATDIRYRR